MASYYILKEPTETPQLIDILGKVDLIENSEGKIAEQLLRNGQCVIAPFGYKNGDHFELRGFNIVRK